MNQNLDGTLSFSDEGGHEIKNATINVSVEDISKQDASSETLCKKVFENVDINTKEVFPFSLDVPVNDRNAHLVVRAHVDVDKDEEVSKGDYITTAMFSVINRGYSNIINVKLERVK